MKDNLAEYLHRIELKNSIPKEKERLKRREWEINIYIIVFAGYAFTAHFYPHLYFAGHTDNRLLILFMLAWFYFQFEYKYFVASYDLAMKIKRRKSLEEPSGLSSKPEKIEEKKVVIAQPHYLQNAYSNFITN